MKTKIVNFCKDSWQLLTEVPGWPDAPRRVRFRRALPILIPCAAILLLLGWNKSYRDPRIEAERASYQALVAQDRELDLLRATCSEQQAAELATRRAKVAQMVLNDPKELGPLLKDLKKAAADHGWNGTFQASDLSTDAPGAETQLTFLQARAKLAPSPGNKEAFSSLLALFERFSTVDKRIDLTRVWIRADEQGRYAVELNLRLLAHSPNEKTP